MPDTAAWSGSQPYTAVMVGSTSASSPSCRAVLTASLVEPLTRKAYRAVSMSAPPELPPLLSRLSLWIVVAGLLGREREILAQVTAGLDEAGSLVGAGGRTPSRRSGSWARWSGRC